MTSYYKLICAGIDVGTDIEENKSKIFQIEHSVVVSFLRLIIHRKAYSRFIALQESISRDGERAIINESDPITLMPVEKIPDICKFYIRGSCGSWVFDIRNSYHLLRCNPYTRMPLSSDERERLIGLLDQMRILLQ